MVYRNKTYVCFDGDSDMHYYRLMQAWHQNDRTSFSFFDAHDLNSARDTSQVENIKRKLRIRLGNSKVMVVLIGERTRYLTKFVRWEMEQALLLSMPIIAVNLNGLRWRDDDRCPPLIREELAMHISYNPAIMQYALEEWPGEEQILRRRGLSRPFYYYPEVYNQLGL
jgi:hypothetical protein